MAHKGIGVMGVTREQHERVVRKPPMIFTATAESTRRDIAKRRARGERVTQCPNCGREVQESELHRIGGTMMCVGLPKEAYCATPSFAR